MATRSLRLIAGHSGCPSQNLHDLITGGNQADAGNVQGSVDDRQGLKVDTSLASMRGATTEAVRRSKPLARQKQ